MGSAEEKYLRIVSGEARGLGPALARAGLRLAEFPFAAIASLRNTLYDRGILASYQLPRTAISVGNLTAGGTGKTPVVQWLARRQLAAGRHPAILLRGYRKGGAAMSDEAAMLTDALPGVRVQVNADRVAGAAEAIAADPTIDCFILDDGMQHRRARREADLVLINARAPFGFGHQHPRGLLREPLGSLKRATAILITHASEAPAADVDKLQQTIRLHTQAPIFHADHRNARLLGAEGPLPMERLEQQRFLAFAGIGNPESLETQLKQFGDRFAGFERFGDHHDYSAHDLERLSSLCRAHRAEVLLTTEKDWAKLRLLPREAGEPPIYRVGLNLVFWEAEEEILYRILAAAVGMAGSPS